MASLAYERFGKRFTDILVAGVILFLILPVLALVAAVVWVGVGHPILFRQRRVGRHNRPFVLVKFRTMRDGTDYQGRTLPDGDRLTKTGAWLRRWSLDELPELCNVLRGDMSLVGPRPLPVKYLNRYTSEQVRRHEVRPGLTGLAQVRGRNALSWARRLALDVWYVDHYTWWLDIKIVLMTVVIVLKGSGITQPGHVTMREFTGSAKGDGAM